MSRKKILVIGAVSLDEIHLTAKAAEAGDVVSVERRHKEYGGRGGNTAISAYRASRPKPGDEENEQDHEESSVEVRLIAGVATNDYQDTFRTRLVRNGVNADSVEVLTRPEAEEGQLPLEQDYMISIMESDTGKTTLYVKFETSDQWPIERFESASQICGEDTPDLVIITAELQRRVVEQIIETLYRAKIDVLLFAAPGEPFLHGVYEMITHLVCNEGDAAKMLGYKPEQVNHETWPEMCEVFMNRGVKNVVIKAGPLGAYFKNADDEGFLSGYTKISDLIDQTGATNAFVGPYAVQYVRNKARWDLRSAVEYGNRAVSLFAIDIGYEAAIPWADEIESAELEPLYDSIERLREGPAKKKLLLRKYRDQRNPVRPRGPTI